MTGQQPTPEQIAELQEKIKNMSPEELREFQKKQCIFCQIIEGKIQAKKIYEDNDVVALLDINPCNPGHLLLLPKEHYAIMPQVPKEVLTHLFVVAKNLSNALLRSIGAQGSNIIVANGVAAGQKAQHFMAHIIPRTENDGIEFTLPQKTLDEKQLQEITEKLREKLGAKIEDKHEPLNPHHQMKKHEHGQHEERKEAMQGQGAQQEPATQSETPQEQQQSIEQQSETTPETQEEDTEEDNDTNTEEESTDEKPKSKKQEVDLDDIADLLGK